VAISEFLDKKFDFIFSEVMSKQFFDFYDYYKEVCTANIHKDGQSMEVWKKLI
jgi:hypothetical protein